ncbi:MAG TPA: hypothetical protein VGQ93_10610 [Lysobacter sp.]|nr:hypothetical protein [Lysobacter sp.]
MVSENETLRWPTNLDRGGIERRLVQVRKDAKAAGLDYLVLLFARLKGKSAAKLGANVIAALTWLQDKPEHRAITTQLEMVAMNLKNLK